MTKLAGIQLAMQTPFNDNGSINFSVLDELIDKYVDAGIHGIVLGSGTGQHPYLTEQECNQLYEAGIKRINGRCKVVCQTSALNVDEVIRRSKQAEDAGADALMILPPYLEGPTDDDGLFKFYEEIDANIKTDIVGYNIPQATQISVSLDLLARLGKLKNFNYIKDSSGDFTTLQEYLHADTVALNGCDTTALYAFLAGAKGSIWGAANFMPHEAVALFNYVQEKNYSAAFLLWEKMLPSLLFVWRNNYFAAVVKGAHLRGFGTGNVRRPVQGLSAEKTRELQEALKPLEGVRL